MSDIKVKYHGWHSTVRRPDDQEAEFSASGGWNVMHGFNTTLTLRRLNKEGKPEVIEITLNEKAARQVHGMIEHAFLDELLCPLREKSLHHDSTCKFCAPRIKTRNAHWEEGASMRAAREKKNRGD